MATVISLFNHKGGVSKTTTTFRLGWKLARLGKKVLIVDADPQCNLTGLTLGLEDYDSLFAFYDSKQNTDIFSSLAPVFAMQNTDSTINVGKTPIAKTQNQNLFILAGNIRFSEIDTQIATALTSSNTIPVLRQFVSAFNNLVRKVASENSVDIILVRHESERFCYESLYTYEFRLFYNSHISRFLLLSSYGFIEQCVSSMG